jgi:hypothetical protein
MISDGMWETEMRMYSKFFHLFDVDGHVFDAGSGEVAVEEDFGGS